MSRSLLHDWEGPIEKNKNNTEELLKIAEDIYNTAYTRGKASTERPQGEWKVNNYGNVYCSNCGIMALCKDFMADDFREVKTDYCAFCGADMRGKEE